MIRRSDTTAEDIDIAMKLGDDYPMGPIELMNYIGLDTSKFITDGYGKKYYYDEPTFQTYSVINKLVSEGKLSRKIDVSF
ncbi:unnamed protein product [Rotaria sordida]|uniref:3-hydroxyacyl-CoA dehydrogenase C-terminal domain-containing protein n=1 Tax=Rotaria sordida TaxID=392033 RepID=A0A814RKC6_9BILA|nr:unnamed protein product [Rotaria sordida]